MFRCVDNSCIPQIYICNGVQDCPCLEDELLCNGSYKESLNLFPHTYHSKLLTMFQKYSSFFMSDDTYHLVHCRTGDNDHYIPDNKWCVYEYNNSNREPLHCPFAEHLKNCSGEKCIGYFKCPNSYCIPYKYICDNTWDCPRGNDEQICHNIHCSNYFHCQNQTICISLTKVCDGVSDCFLADDEIFCQVLCPSQCLCIGTGVRCPTTGISKIPSFGEKYEHNILFLNLEGNPLQLHVLSFVHLDNLQYLNISNSNINHLCPRKISLFLLLKKLLILDVSKNKIFSLSTMCILGLSRLKLLYIQQNPLKSIYSKSFFDLYSLPVLKLHNMDLNYIGNYFFCSNFNSNLQLLDISRNKLSMITSETFKCLSNLKILLIYGNRFHKFLSEDVIQNLPLIIYHVEHSVECCKVSVAVCTFINQFTVSCNTKDLPTKTLISMQLPILFLCLVPNIVLLVVLLLTGLYQKKPLQFLLTVKDMIAVSSYTSLSIFTLNFDALSAMLQIFCVAIGVLTSVTFIFDLFVKVVESVFLLKLLGAKFVQRGPTHSVIIRFYSLIFIFMFIGTFIFYKILSIEEQVSLSIKLRETLLHCVLFCFPNYTKILALFSLVLFLLIFQIVLNLKFIHSLRAQIFHMKDLGSKSVKHKKMIRHVSFSSLTTSCIVITLCLLLLTLSFTSSFFISYCVVIILCLYSMNNLITFLLSNQTVIEIVKGCFSRKKI